MTQATPDTLELLQSLFVQRFDSYAVQQPNGQYIRVQQPLTREILEQHREGKITIGAYQLDPQNMVKTLIWDLDPEKLEDPKATADKILTECINKPDPKEPRFYKQSILLEASRYPDPSYHIWVFFWPVSVNAAVARWFGLKILEHANLSPKTVEVFPKQTELTETRLFGNFVKLPLGKHQACGKWSRFLDLESFEPLPNKCLAEVCGASFGERDIAKILGFAEQKHIQIKLTAPSKQIKLGNKEETRIAKFLAKYWRPGIRNQLELYFLGWAMKKGIPYESALRIIDAVTTLTQDEEKQARLDLVKYHFENRGSMLPELKGISGIREILKELKA